MTLDNVPNGEFSLRPLFILLLLLVPVHAPPLPAIPGYIQQGAAGIYTQLVDSPAAEAAADSACKCLLPDCYRRSETLIIFITTDLMFSEEEIALYRYAGIRSDCLPCRGTGILGADEGQS
jgi:hypothetical protein